MFILFYVIHIEDIIRSSDIFNTVLVLDLMSIIRSLPLSQSFAVSSIGQKIMTDATEMAGTRHETAGPLEEPLQAVLDATIQKDNLDEMSLGYDRWKTSHMEG